MDKYRFSRRQFLGNGIAAAGMLALGGALPAHAMDWQEYSTDFSEAIGGLFPDGPLRPDDDAGWRQIAKNYAVARKVTNLENAYWGIMAAPVLAEYKRFTEFVNAENSHFARLKWVETLRGVRQSVADFLGVGSDEIVLTRGATETLQSLIGGYNKLKPGDTVLYADLDYGEMKTAMRWLKERRGANPVKATFPEPTKEQPLTEADILAFYRRALDDNPGTKLLLLTHLNNLTGLIIPVAKIAKMAKERGAAVILDAAHSIGQIDLKVKDLGCDFIGFNLHKWIGAPIGCGVMYIRKASIGDIDTFMHKAPGSTSISDRMDTGTVNFAAHMTIPAAIGFHSRIGTAAKEARLRHLRDIWAGPARKMKGVTVLTPDDPKMVGALTSFRLDGVTTTKSNDALAKHLTDKYGILTVRRTGPDAGDCIRVTPSIYTAPEDVMKLVKALSEITASPYSF